MDWLLGFDLFPARWECGAGWQEHPWLGWMHILSDLGIFAAYLAIPFVIRRVTALSQASPAIVRSARWLGLFVLFCGLGHAIDAGMFWVPAYPLQGIWKLLTAVVSLVAAAHLARSAILFAISYRKTVEARDQAVARLSLEHDRIIEALSREDIEGKELALTELLRNVETGGQDAER